MAARRAARDGPQTRAVGPEPLGAHVVSIGKLILGEVRGRRRGKVNPAFCATRIGEVQRLIILRHGGPVDTDDGPSYVEAVAALYLDLNREKALDRLTAFAKRFAPLVGAAEIAKIIDRSCRRRGRDSADKVAHLLCVTAAERQALDLRTIGACDIEALERQRQAKSRKIQRQRDRRRARGSKTRAEFEAGSLRARAAALGISVSTLQRRERAMRKA